MDFSTGIYFVCILFLLSRASDPDLHLCCLSQCLHSITLQFAKQLHQGCHTFSSMAFTHSNQQLLFPLHSTDAALHNSHTIQLHQTQFFPFKLLVMQCEAGFISPIMSVWHPVSSDCLDLSPNHMLSCLLHVHFLHSFMYLESMQFSTTCLL